MNKEEILTFVDHTNLKTTATWENIKELCDDCLKYNAQTVCIPPYYIRKVRETYGDNIKICTVIGFPNGYSTKEVKMVETINALDLGADEIDMVININAVKNQDFEYVLDEICSITKICHNFEKENNKDTTLKVIIETCDLTEAEKIRLCEIISESGADFIKTSTGFSKSGATLDDIKLFTKHLTNKNVQIKAAGGISSFEDAESFIKLGTSRLGTSRLISQYKNENNNNNTY